MAVEDAAQIEAACGRSLREQVRAASDEYRTHQQVAHPFHHLGLTFADLGTVLVCGKNLIAQGCYWGLTPATRTGLKPAYV